MDSELFIRKKPEQPDETDFQQLQRSALETIQRLSGNLWTDFNEHDPGVTIMDALNYAITELNYQCSFPLEDYLNGSENGYKPDEFGLFRPDQVYPSSPVTEQDYCKLIFDSVEEIAGLWMVKAEGVLPGIFDIILDLIPTATDSDREEIYQKVFRIYHQNRNLCENLGKIHFREKEMLEMAGEIELDEDADVSEVLARAYFICAKYFNPGMKYHDLRELLSSNPNWPNLFDGPLLRSGIIDNDSVMPAKMTFFISDVHYQIRKIKGVRTVKNIFLTKDEVCYSDEIQCSDIFHSYTIRFPSTKQDVQLLLLKGNKEALYNFDEMVRWYKKLIVAEYGHQNQYAGLIGGFSFTKGNYNNFSGYSSVQNDFPDFYGINDKGVPNYFDEKRKAQAKQLKGYLLAFDMAMAGSLHELNTLNQLLNIGSSLPKAIFPNLENTVSHWDELIDRDKYFIEPEDSVLYKLKARNALFDLLDSIYGEKSLLPFSDEFDVYHSDITNPLEKINRRANFISNETNLIPERSRAVDLTVESSDNVAGLKKWISLIMGFPGSYELPVTNIFSKFSLRLLSDKEFYDDLKGLLNIDFVINNLDENFRNEVVFDIPELQVPDPVENYKKFREKVYLLHHNLIFESFLRNGIHIESYKIVQPEKELYLLAYHSEDQAEWVGLGRFDSREEAVEVANELKEFLIYLNRQSENFYLIEHLLMSGKKEEEGYIIHVSNNNQLLFDLLKPVIREEIFRIRNEFENVLTNTERFQIRLAENGRFVIYFETSEDNALYCQQTFETEAEALAFIDFELKNQKFAIDIFYQFTDNLLLPSDFMDFGLTVVFPNWSARFHNEKFRKWFEEQIEERCPAHIKLNFLWLAAPAIRQFEKIYFAWRSALVSGILVHEKSVALVSFLNEHLLRNNGYGN
jgi:hypothetical protein